MTYMMSLYNGILSPFEIIKKTSPEQFNHIRKNQNRPLFPVGGFNFNILCQELGVSGVKATVSYLFSHRVSLVFGIIKGYHI